MRRKTCANGLLLLSRYQVVQPTWVSISCRVQVRQQAQVLLGNKIILSATVQDMVYLLGEQKVKLSQVRAETSVEARRWYSLSPLWAISSKLDFVELWFSLSSGLCFDTLLDRSSSFLILIMMSSIAMSSLFAHHPTSFLFGFCLPSRRTHLTTRVSSLTDLIPLKVHLVLQNEHSLLIVNYQPPLWYSHYSSQSSPTEPFLSTSRTVFLANNHSNITVPEA